MTRGCILFWVWLLLCIAPQLFWWILYLYLQTPVNGDAGVICIPKFKPVVTANNTAQYTPHHFYGITLLGPPVYPTAGGNLCQCNYQTPDDINKSSCGPLTNFNGRPSLCPVPVSLLSRGCWLPQLHRRLCCAFLLTDFSCAPSMYASYHFKSKWQSCKPISCVIEHIVLFTGLRLSQMKCRELLQRHKMWSKKC